MATRKKGKGRQAVRNGSGGMPGWGWALIGILAGAVLMAFAMHGSLIPMKKDGPEPNPQATAQRGSEPGVADQAEPEKPKKPSYDFYSVLSEKEVRIPDSEIHAQANAEAQQKQQQQATQVAQQQATQQAATTPPPAAQPAANPNLPKASTQTVTATPSQPAAQGGSGYLLQVGAFPSAADAESLKAKLALQGFVANVQSVKVGTQTYNRVRLGPFKSATDLESTKQRLQSAGISAIALKEGG